MAVNDRYIYGRYLTVGEEKREEKTAVHMNGRFLLFCKALIQGNVTPESTIMGGIDSSCRRFSMCSIAETASN